MVQSAIVFTAAGSGGHIFAALATLKAFQENYPTLTKDVIFVGSTLTMEGEVHQVSMEERLCLRMGVPFRKIRMGKLQRQLSVNSIKLAAKVVLGFIDAWKLLRDIKPKVIVAFGGYVSFPLVIVGKLLGSKIILHEQTSNIGLTNKLLQRYADVIGVTFDTSLPYFKKKALVVGSPTMPHIYEISDFDHLLGYLKHEKSRILEEVDYIEKLRWIGLQRAKTPILLVSGGSQGSHFLNEQVLEILPDLLKTMIVVIQTGENELYNDFRTVTEYVKTLPGDLAQRCIIRRFVYEEYGYLMKNADLFLGRSGANTVYQVGMNALRAIFIPIPWVTRNEQFTNAMILKEKGFAEIIEQDRCTPTVLLGAITEQMSISRSKPPKEMEVPLFPLDAAARLAQEIGKLAV